MGGGKRKNDVVSVERAVSKRYLNNTRRKARVFGQDAGKNFETGFMGSREKKTSPKEVQGREGSHTNWKKELESRARRGGRNEMKKFCSKGNLLEEQEGLKK